MIKPGEFVASAVCALHTGSDSYNVIPDYARIRMTIRTFNDETNDRIENNIRNCAQSCSKRFGGTAKVDAGISYPSTINDFKICDLMHSSHVKVVGDKNAIEVSFDIFSEDFPFYSRIRPSCNFKLGTRNEKKNCVQALHSNDFLIDEDALSMGCKAFVQFVLYRTIDE